jgi:hypothetical protein
MIGTLFKYIILMSMSLLKRILNASFPIVPSTDLDREMIPFG